MRTSRNTEGYADPTAAAAIARIIAEERKARNKGQRRKRNPRKRRYPANGGHYGQKL